MDRELLLVTLAGLMCGPLLLLAGALRLRLRRHDSVRELERHAWRRLWLPMLPAGLVLAFLIGWTIQEPNAAEAADLALCAVAALFGFVWLRAIVRAARAARMPAQPAVAMTSGLLRPRVFVAPALSERLDDQALRAALEHEAAHARHRDPMRLWLAQIATDLQWPSSAARQRFVDWRNALELARDAEACDHVDGSDLATALIEAARLGCRSSVIPAAGPVAGLVNDRDGARAFTDRIHRLLDRPRDLMPTARGRWARWALLVSILGGAIAAGVLCGELVISALPGLDSA